MLSTYLWDVNFLMVFSKTPVPVDCSTETCLLSTIMLSQAIFGEILNFWQKREEIFIFLVALSLFQATTFIPGNNDLFPKINFARWGTNASTNRQLRRAEKCNKSLFLGYGLSTNKQKVTWCRRFCPSCRCPPLLSSVAVLRVAVLRFSRSSLFSLVVERLLRCVSLVFLPLVSFAVWDLSLRPWLFLCCCCV